MILTRLSRGLGDHETQPNNIPPQLLTYFLLATMGAVLAVCGPKPTVVPTVDPNRTPPAPGQFTDEISFYAQNYLPNSQAQGGGVGLPPREALAKLAALAHFESDRIAVYSGKSAYAQTNGVGSRTAGLALTYQLVSSAEWHWRKVRAPHLVALVRSGAKLRNGVLVSEQFQSKSTIGTVTSGTAT